MGVSVESVCVNRGSRIESNMLTPGRDPQGRQVTTVSRFYFRDRGFPTTPVVSKGPDKLSPGGTRLPSLPLPDRPHPSGRNGSEGGKGLGTVVRCLRGNLSACLGRSLDQDPTRPTPRESVPFTLGDSINRETAGTPRLDTAGGSSVDDTDTGWVGRLSGAPVPGVPRKWFRFERCFYVTRERRLVHGGVPDPHVIEGRRVCVSTLNPFSCPSVVSGGSRRGL